MPTKVYRIRRFSGYKDGPNYYHHADVIERNWWRALRAAKEGRVRNWRWIDTYDTSNVDYCQYAYLYSYPADHEEAFRNHARRPQTKKEQEEFNIKFNIKLDKRKQEALRKASRF